MNDTTVQKYVLHIIKQVIDYIQSYVAVFQ